VRRTAHEHHVEVLVSQRVDGVHYRFRVRYGEGPALKIIILIPWSWQPTQPQQQPKNKRLTTLVWPDSSEIRIRNLEYSAHISTNRETTLHIPLQQATVSQITTATPHLHVQNDQRTHGSQIRCVGFHHWRHCTVHRERRVRVIIFREHTVHGSDDANASNPSRHDERANRKTNATKRI
jgi:hypothetical protein